MRVSDEVIATVSGLQGIGRPGAPGSMYYEPVRHTVGALFGPGDAVGIFGVFAPMALAGIHEVGELSAGAARMDFSSCRADYEACLERLRAHESAHGALGGIGETWLERKAREAREALERAAREAAARLQQAAAAVQQAGTQAAAAAQAAAQRAASSGQNAVDAARRAYASVKRAVTAARVRALSAVKRAVHLSPARRVMAYLALGGPVGAIAAYKFTKRHREAVVNDLPASYRAFVNRTMDQLEGVFDGKRSDVSGLPGSIGTWADVRRKIGAAWDHLSKTKKGLIILAFVIALIIVIVVVYYTGGAAVKEAIEAVGKALWVAIKFIAHTFWTALGPKGLIGILKILLRRAGGGGVPSIPTDLPDPATDAAVITPAEEATYEATYENMEDVDDPDSISDGAGLAYAAGGSAAALLALGAL